MVMVKICGITNKKDLEAAVEAGADSLGFVVGVPASPRNLLFSQVKHLITKVPRNISTVAVTVFKTSADLMQIFKGLKTNYLQLHGNLHSILKSLNALPRSRIIGAVDGRGANALNLAVESSVFFQSILLDTAGNGGLGGTGIAHDWYRSKNIRDAIYPTPLILAGGLTPKNVGKAIRIVKPYGVDVSTGVEKNPGIKDHEKIREFVARAKEVKL